MPCGERAFDAGDHHVEIVEGAERDLPTPRRPSAPSALT